MKLLREYIRQLLKEGIHPNISNMIKRAKKEGRRLELHDDGVMMRNADGLMTGHINWFPPRSSFGKCLGAKVVGYSESEAGYGPLLYDIAIEATGGLAPDRRGVSPDATSVWSFYETERPDIKVSQLDDLNNKLTPTDADNCLQASAIWLRAEDWLDSPLSKAYSKQGTPVIDRLREWEMIDEK